MKRVVAVFGYNNTRLYDVIKIKSILAKQKIGIMLCKEGITAVDREVSPYCFDTKLQGSQQAIEQSYLNFKAWLCLQAIEVVGVLPFSDKGVLLGSYVAEKMGLVSDDYRTAIIGLDKLQFREAEASIDTPTWYRKPRFQRVTEVIDISRFYSEVDAPVFVKPTQEGNSRGCFLVRSVEDIETAYESIAPYMNEGAIVEEYIENAREFSFDAVAERCWITEKETTTGHYRAEIQQIIPAPLDREGYGRLIEAGRLISRLSGSRKGAVHNELFLTPDNTVIAVEPNRRPAGAHIWDMATHVYPGFNPFELWIDWSIGKSVFPIRFIQPQQYVGIRMIFASIDGVIQEVDHTSIEKIKGNVDGILNVSLSKKLNDIVWQVPKDNEGFLGYVMARHKDPQQLKKILKELCHEVAGLVKIRPICEKKYEFPLVEKIRANAEKEKVLVFDCAYMKPFIEAWWNNLKDNTDNNEKKEQLKGLLLEKFKNGEQFKLNKVGVSEYYISVIIMTGLFTTDSPELAYIVHEALSDLAGIKDIKYPYEDHKQIFIEPEEGIQKEEWGRGAGAISPHCDDLYEDNEVELLSLTTCRDNLNVSTLLFTASQIFKTLSDNEINQLTRMMPVFLSGINVKDVVKEKKRPVLSYKNSNFFMALDYRVDESMGVRMRVADESDLMLLNKIKAYLTPENAVKASSETGNFIILSNSKVLHAREAVQAVKELYSLDLDSTPRLLFRSKGPRS